MSDTNISFLLETIHDDTSKKVSLRVSVRRNLADKQAKITSKTILGLLHKRGLDKYFVFEEQIDAVVADLNLRLESLLSGSNLYEDAYVTPVIAEARDAMAEVKISEDSLEAYIRLTPAKGGKDLDIDSLNLILNENGVKYGSEKQLLFNLLQTAKKSENDEPVEMLVARAKLPVQGLDTQFIPQVETANERILKPQLRPDGTIDMRELGNLPIVKANEVIMQKLLFTQGEDGIDICGNQLKAEPGKDFDFVPGPGSIINPANSNELIAAFNGQPNLTHNGMKVENVVKVKVVDLSTGNIDIDANLLVEGDITECMRVRCTGNITVGGVIESADVQSAGSIFVGKGIVGQVPRHVAGQEDQLTTHVKAGKSINAVFASYSRLEAGVEIHLDEQLLHCDSTSNDKITVGSQKTVGSQIIGGITRAKSTIESDIVGSHAGILTRFDLSALYLEKQQAISDFEKDITSRNDQLIKLSNTYKQLSSHQLRPEMQEKANRLKNTILQLKEVLLKLESEAEKMREDRELETQNLKILVKRRVHPCVEVKIGSRKFRSNRAMVSGKIGLKDGELCHQAENLDQKKP